MKLIIIPKEKYEDYRLDAMFDCYKWDPQFFDSNTVARYALILSKDEANTLASLTEKVDKETRNAENFLNRHLEFVGPLALPCKLKRHLSKMKNYDETKHVRLMRYDFHPTVEGTWALSEVNSDVPGGFAESSLLPALAKKYLGRDDLSYIDFSNYLVEAISQKVKPNGKIMMVHCTSYSDDRQVMQFLGDKLKEKGFQIIYGAADHLKFENHKAISILGGNEGEIDGIVRFSPLEWISDMKTKDWPGFFDCETPACNHPVAMFAQTKRFPLVWDTLTKYGINISTWKKLLPETIEVKDASEREGFIFKPACGRVGENISIKEACKDDEYEKILKDVEKHPRRYLAQKKFISKPVVGENKEEFHVCVGSYTVEGKHAGFYARISNVPRIDSFAADIPVLIEG